YNETVFAMMKITKLLGRYAFKEDFLMKILLVDGTIIGRKTGAILEQVKTYIQDFNPEMELVILNLADYEHQFVDGRPLGEYNKDMPEIVHRFENADGYIIATPIFQGSIPGVLKNTFDMLHIECVFQDTGNRALENRRRNDVAVRIFETMNDFRHVFIVFAERPAIDELVLIVGQVQNHQFHFRIEILDICFHLF